MKKPALAILFFATLVYAQSTGPQNAVQVADGSGGFVGSAKVVVDPVTGTLRFVGAPGATGNISAQIPWLVRPSEYPLNGEFGVAMFGNHLATNGQYNTSQGVDPQSDNVASFGWQPNTLTGGITIVNEPHYWTSGCNNQYVSSVVSVSGTDVTWISGGVFDITGAWVNAQPVIAGNRVPIASKIADVIDSQHLTLSAPIADADSTTFVLSAAARENYMLWTNQVGGQIQGGAGVNDNTLRFMTWISCELDNTMQVGFAVDSFSVTAKSQGHNYGDAALTVHTTTGVSGGSSSFSLNPGGTFMVTNAAHDELFYVTDGANVTFGLSMLFPAATTSRPSLRIPVAENAPTSTMGGELWLDPSGSYFVANANGRNQRLLSTDVIPGAAYDTLFLGPVGGGKFVWRNMPANTTTQPKFYTSTGDGTNALTPTYTASTGRGSVVLSNSPVLGSAPLGGYAPMGGSSSTIALDLGAYQAGVFELPNNGAAAPHLNKLVTLTCTSSVCTATAASASQAHGVLGIAVANAGTSGNVKIAREGVAYCSFSGGYTVGNWVVTSSNPANPDWCMDSGVPATTSYPSGMGQVIGILISSTGIVGNLPVLLVR